MLSFLSFVFKVFLKGWQVAISLGLFKKKFDRCLSTFFVSYVVKVKQLISCKEKKIYIYNI